MNVNDLTTAQIETIIAFRHEFPNVKVWPSGEYGVVLLHTMSAGTERVSRLLRDGSTTAPMECGIGGRAARAVREEGK